MSVQLLWPVAGCERVTSPYGWRYHPVHKTRSFHTGIDIAAPAGSSVWAPLTGKIAAVFDAIRSGGGLTVVIRGSIGGREVQAGVCHLSRALVRVGDVVSAGAEIAKSGGIPGAYGSGSSTAPHVHLTVRIDGSRVDPQGDAISWRR